MSRRGFIWKFFTKENGSDYRGICLNCSESLSYKATTGNLATHLRKRHPILFKHFKSGTLPGTSKTEVEDQDDDSNSSVKFSSEIWGQFELEESLARCVICRKTTDNTIEDMKSHLEEEHPGILISILHNKSNAGDPIDDERLQVEANEEDNYTEVVYLEEEIKQKLKNPLKRTKFSKKAEKEECPKIEYKTVQSTPAGPVKESERPEIDTFLSYVGVLLRNVSKESLPKLQLDVISLILNAQIAVVPNAGGKVAAGSTENIQITIHNSDVSA